MDFFVFVLPEKDGDPKGLFLKSGAVVTGLFALQGQFGDLSLAHKIAEQVLSGADDGAIADTDHRFHVRNISSWASFLSAFKEVADVPNPRKTFVHISGHGEDKDSQSYLDFGAGNLENVGDHSDEIPQLNERVTIFFETCKSFHIALRLMGPGAGAQLQIWSQTGICQSRLKGSKTVFSMGFPEIPLVGCPCIYTLEKYGSDAFEDIEDLPAEALVDGIRTVVKMLQLSKQEHLDAIMPFFAKYK